MPRRVHAPVPPGATRSYDVRGRRELAEASRRHVLTCARRLFLANGFGATKIAEIAHAAGVSPESVYKNFGGKPGLVRSIHEQSLLGAAGPPAELRSDVAQLTSTDPLALLEQFGRFSAEISPLGAPVILLIREAAASGDEDMAALLREIDDARYRRMLHNARQITARGLLRPGLSAEEAADVMFTCTTAELYESLVGKRGWPAERYGSFIARTLAANLL